MGTNQTIQPEPPHAAEPEHPTARDHDQQEGAHSHSPDTLLIDDAALPKLVWAGRLPNSRQREKAPAQVSESVRPRTVAKFGVYARPEAMLNMGAQRPWCELAVQGNVEAMWKCSLSLWGSEALSCIVAECRGTTWTMRPEKYTDPKPWHSWAMLSGSEPCHLRVCLKWKWSSPRQNKL